MNSVAIDSHEDSIVTESHSGETTFVNNPVALFEASVLIAEDNQVNQEVARMMLEVMGCRIAQAETGLEAVDLATKVSYDLILMDCQMPQMDGFEAARLIRDHEGNSDKSVCHRSTIIAMTGNNTDEDRDLCLANGMDDFLRKPFTFNELNQVMRRWLPVSNSACMQLEAEDPPMEKDSPIDFKCLDNIVALQRGGSPDILVRVIDHYLEETPKVMKKLDDAVRKNDGEVICSEVHRFKSGSANLGALRLAEICREMEVSAMNMTVTENRLIMDKIEEEYEAVRIALVAVREGEWK
jgi:two-component system sensor histidine kinase/response regulator